MAYAGSAESRRRRLFLAFGGLLIVILLCRQGLFVRGAVSEDLLCEARMAAGLVTLVCECLASHTLYASAEEELAN